MMASILLVLTPSLLPEGHCSHFGAGDIYGSHSFSATSSRAGLSVVQMIALN
tara:strand:+ start:499 stop:654 length:156 start_codon:yes stop_codon:yes gene_type:complete